MELIEQLISSGTEEKVSINQRSLINKLLARYKGQFTVFRELIQNSDDAKATCMKIKISDDVLDQFGKRELNTKELSVAKYIIVENDGLEFTEDDWQRLIKIAEGNPNEEATGCFGVGFYSVFSITENPIVTSGDQQLAFVWKEDQLTTFRKKLVPKNPQKSGVRDGEKGEKSFSSFLFPLRDPKLAEFDILEFCKYLLQCLCFTKTLNSIQIQRNRKILYQISKELSSSVHNFSSSLFKDFKSPEKLLELSNVEKKQIRFSIKKECGEEEGEEKDISIEFEEIEGLMKVKLNGGVEEQMNRIIGKKFPKSSKVKILFHSSQKEFPLVNQNDNSNIELLDGDEELSSNNKKAAVQKEKTNNLSSLLEGLSPFPNGGKIFIGGFASHQTTGTGFHLSGQLIPTVERENIDFNDQYLSKWNKDIIFMAGKLSRMYYDFKMNPKEKELEPQSKLRMIEAFSFLESTPSGEVSQLLSDAFFDQQDVPIIPCLLRSSESQQIQSLPSTDVYLALHGMGELEYITLPLVSLSQRNNFFSINKFSIRFFENLRRKKLLQLLTFKILLEHSKTKTLTKDQLIQFLQWYVNKCNESNSSNKSTKDFATRLKTQKENFLDSISFQMESDRIYLRELKYFCSEKECQLLPLPKDVLSYDICIQFAPPKKLQKEPLSLSPLPFGHWWEFAREHPSLEEPDGSIRILEFLAKKWKSIPTDEKKKFIEPLQEKKCILTDMPGKSKDDSKMQRPHDSYVPNSKLPFQDLPFASERLTSCVPNKILKEIGLRNSPEVKLVFTKIESLKWDTKKLIQFLMKNELSLDDEDWKFLKSYSFLPACRINTRELKPTELIHFPNNEGQLLQQFGFFVLDLKETLTTSEKTFLKKMGVKECPDLKDILELCSSSKDLVQQEKAFEYLLNHFDSHYKDTFKSIKKEGYQFPAFIPTNDTKIPLATPTSCFYGNLKVRYSIEEIQLLCNYLECREVKLKYKDEVKKLGVGDHPPVLNSIQKLISQPPTKEESFFVFDYLSTFQAEITPDQWKTLQNTEFIPTDKKEQKNWLSPQSIFLPTEENCLKYGNLLDYVDSRYSKGAKFFLKMCGCSENPNPIQLSWCLVKNHRKFLEACGVYSYIQVLHEISQSFAKLPSNLQNTLKTSPVMIGIKNKTDEENVQNSNSKTNLDDDSDDTEEESKNASLALAKDCLLIDNSDFQRIFNPLSVPFVSLELEKMYESLGSQWISSLIEEKTSAIGNGKVSPKSTEIQNTIKRRKGLLLNDLNSCKPREYLKKNANTILDNLQVLEVEKIKRTLTLGKQKKEMETSICTKDANSIHPIIFITNTTTTLALSSEMASILLAKKGKEDTLKFFAILQTSLSSLRQQGYPVDRLLSPYSTITTTAIVTNSIQIEEKKEEKEIKTGAQTSSSLTRTSKKSEGITHDPKHLNSLLSKAVSTIPSSESLEVIRELGKDVVETRCETRCARNLVKVASIGGISVFINEGESESMFTGDRRELAESFATLLKNLANVFSIKKVEQVVRIFLDDSSGTIAFNLNGGLHFNLLSFQKLNSKKYTILHSCFYWYTIFCHELAHNLVEMHNEEHSFWTEQLACNYFDKLYSKLSEWNSQQPSHSKNNHCEIF